jgi:PilZ domain
MRANHNPLLQVAADAADKEGSNGQVTHDGVHYDLGSCTRIVPFIDRRRNPRWSFTAAVSVLDPASGARVDAHTTDLSPGGCYVDAMNSFTLGTKVQLRITREGNFVEADAVVAYSEPGVGMGLKLITIAPGHRAVLDHWFAELRADVRSTLHTLDEVKDVLPLNTLKRESDYALEELLLILMRKGLMTEEEGEPILRRLLR